MVHLITRCPSVVLTPKRIDEGSSNIKIILCWCLYPIYRGVFNNSPLWFWWCHWKMRYLLNYLHQNHIKNHPILQKYWALILNRYHYIRSHGERVVGAINVIPKRNIPFILHSTNHCWEIKPWADKIVVPKLWCNVICWMKIGSYGQ